MAAFLDESFRSENVLFDITQPPKLDEATLGDIEPAFDELKVPLTARTRISMNMHAPLPESVLHKICRVIAYQVVCYRMNIVRRMALGHHDQWVGPSFFHDTNARIGMRFATYHLQSVFQARIHYQFYPQNWNQVYHQSFVAIVEDIMDDKLELLMVKCDEFGLSVAKLDESLMEFLFEKIKALNDQIDDVQRNRPNNLCLKALTVLVSDASPAASTLLGPVYEANRATIKQLRGDIKRFIRKVSFPALDEVVSEEFDLMERDFESVRA